jgi:hypothetical protein
LPKRSQRPTRRKSVTSNATSKFLILRRPILGDTRPNRFLGFLALHRTFAQAGVASRHLVTAGSSTTLTGDPYTLAFSATLHPVTGQLEWSETDRLCWV